jgi:hypothetical protein
MANRRSCFCVVVVLLIFCVVAARAQSGDRLSTMWRYQGPLVFAAAASTQGVLRPVSEKVLGSDWETWDFVDLINRLDPVLLEQGFETLTSALHAMPADEQYSALYDMELWIACYRAIETLRDVTTVETFGSAVALVTAVTAEFPRNPEVIEKMGKDVGSTLAAAENSELMYNVATRMSRMKEREVAMTIRDLYAAAIESYEDR